jgi:DNA-binding NarL/FixJ family response regulator
LLADLDGAARRALAALLQRLDGIALVAEVGERNGLSVAVRRHRPDVLIIDDRLLGSVEHVLIGLGPMATSPRVIVIGMIDEPAYAERARRLGAEAWIAKDRADEDLPQLLDRR